MKNTGIILLAATMLILIAGGCSPAEDTVEHAPAVDPEVANVVEEVVDLGEQPAETGPEGNLAFNADREGYPHPLESSIGWGGGADKWEIVDGTRNYEEWQHGLAFTGGRKPYHEPAGWRQATIDFGEPTTFDCVVVWHHCTGDEQHKPNTYRIEYWDGDEWVELFSTTSGRDYLWYRTDNPTEWWEYWSTPTVNTFEPVTGSKVRFALHNRDLTHGWIYEFEVYYLNGQ